MPVNFQFKQYPFKALLDWNNILFYFSLCVFVELVLSNGPTEPIRRPVTYFDCLVFAWLRFVGSRRRAAPWRHSCQWFIVAVTGLSTGHYHNAASMNRVSDDNYLVRLSLSCRRPNRAIGFNQTNQLLGSSYLLRYCSGNGCLFLHIQFFMDLIAHRFVVQLIALVCH